MVKWVEANWCDFLGSVLVVVELSRGWFCFNFLETGHIQKVLARNWSLDHTPLLLKPWHPMFDMSRERIDEVPVWVRLLGLPLHCWSKEHFRSIGNMMGKFLEAALSLRETLQPKVARILV